MIYFDIDDVRQIKPTIAGKMSFKNLRYEDVKKYYGFIAEKTWPWYDDFKLFHNCHTSLEKRYGMEDLKIYRKRLIPNECIWLKNDIVLLCNEEFIVTKW